MRITPNPLLKFETDQDELTESLSAALFVGESLWVASDELTSVERLSTSDDQTFQNHVSFPLEGLLDLPATGTTFDKEIDIEGLDVRDSHLWLVGSHSIKRKKVESDDKDDDAKLIKKLSKTEAEGNRYILARIPLIKGGAAGELELPDPDGDTKGVRLEGDLRRNALTDALRQAEGGKGDPHLGKFLDIPGKDNGLDIEGLAVGEEKVFLGLRGPVLRGWAVVLELSVDTSDPAQLALKNLGQDGRPYRKHFLDLAGLGVRDLCLHGDDLLVLAGPTMNLDGPAAIYRWKNAVKAGQDSLVRSTQLTRLLEIPFGQGTDHPEGFTIVPAGEQPRQILVVYDSPSERRKVGPGQVQMDVFDIPAA